MLYRQPENLIWFLLRETSKNRRCQQTYLVVQRQLRDFLGRRQILSLGSVSKCSHRQPCQFIVVAQG